MAWHDAVLAALKQFLKDAGLDFKPGQQQPTRSVNGKTASQITAEMKSLREKIEIDRIVGILSPYFGNYWKCGSCGCFLKLTQESVGSFSYRSNQTFELMDLPSRVQKAMQNGISVPDDITNETMSFRCICASHKHTGCVRKYDMAAKGSPLADSEQVTGSIFKVCDQCSEHIPYSAKKCKSCRSDAA
jgi:hypothetical protein